jgi:hypothetical protein
MEAGRVAIKAHRNRRLVARRLDVDLGIAVGAAARRDQVADDEEG